EKQAFHYGLSFKLFDRGSVNIQEENFLYNFEYENKDDSFFNGFDLNASRFVEVSDRLWEVRIEKLVQVPFERNFALIVSVVGVILSFLISFIVFIFTRSNVRAISIAENMTVSLRNKTLALEKTNQKLKITESDLQNNLRDVQKFQLAVANTSDHVVITDEKGIILFANKAAEKITGFGLKEMIGRKAGSSLWGGQMPKKFYMNMWKTIAIKRKNFNSEIKNRRKNGEIYYAETHISPILDEKGDIKFFVSIERDISKAKEVDRMKTEFVSLASHQLNAPLNSVKWLIEILLGGDAGKLTGQQKELMNQVHEANERMLELVKSLLNVSRMELGNLKVEPELLDMRIIAKDVLKEQNKLIMDKKLKVTFDYDDTLPKIKLDPKLIRVIYQNLISNAVKYTPEEGLINCEVKKVGKKFVIKVADTGCGIPENQKDRMFKRLFRASNVAGSDIDGNGLGLYLVKEIVEKSKGKIWFESEENKGATFYVEMPIVGMKKNSGK
ncbi:MAG: ATP-binding protein, partial [Candidatus Peregrinibacteria bacterium]|nr:ATP-binding protein [Candidatus Peregrinibacteria bacterium]